VSAIVTPSVMFGEYDGQATVFLFLHTFL